VTCRLHHIGYRLLLDRGFLPLAPRHAIVVVAEVGALHFFQELFVVRDHNQLEVGLVPPRLDDVMQRCRQRADVVSVQVRRRLVQSDETAVDPEAFGQRQADDDAGQHLLSSAAPASHVHLRVLLDHTNPVVIRSILPGPFVVGANQDRINIRALVGLLPQFFDDAVDFLHLDAVVFHDCPGEPFSC